MPVCKFQWLTQLNDLLPSRATSWIKYSLLLTPQWCAWNLNQCNWKRGLLLKCQLKYHILSNLCMVYKENCLFYGSKKGIQRSFWTLKEIPLSRIVTRTAIGMFSNKNLPGKGGFKQLLSLPWNLIFERSWWLWFYHPQWRTKLMNL